MSKEINTSDIDESGLQNADPIPVKSKPWWKLGGKDFSFVSVNAGYTESTNSNSSSEIKLEQQGTKNLGRHVYETEDTKEIYKPIVGYEGAHRFDPNFTWDPEEEKRLVRIVSFFSVCSPFTPFPRANKSQLDWRIALPACIMFFALQLDRGNITQAISDTMLSE